MFKAAAHSGHLISSHIAFRTALSIMFLRQDLQEEDFAWLHSGEILPSGCSVSQGCSSMQITQVNVPGWYLSRRARYLCVISLAIESTLHMKHEAKELEIQKA